MAGRHAHAATADAPPSSRRRPAPSTVDLHTHTLRSDGVLQPAALVAGRGGGRGPRPSRSPTTTRSPAIASWSLRGGRCPAADRAASRASRSTRSPRGDLGLREGELHILGFGMDPADEAFEAALARQRARPRASGSSGRSRDCARSASPIDAQVATPRPGRRRRARPADDRAGADRRRATRRASRTRSAGSSAGAPGVRAARGDGPERGDPGDPRRRRRPGPGPLLARRRPAPRCSASSIEIGLAGLEVYYRSFDAETVDAVGARRAPSSGLLATGGTDYHGDLGRTPRPTRALWVPPEVGRRCA